MVVLKEELLSWSIRSPIPEFLWLWLALNRLAQRVGVEEKYVPQKSWITVPLVSLGQV